MSKESEMKLQCSTHIHEVMMMMKNKVGYDEDDMIFLMKKWAKIGSLMFLHRPEKGKGKYYPKFIKPHFTGGTVKATAEIYDNPPMEDDSKAKLSVYFYNRLVELANNIYVDAGYAESAFQRAEGAILRMVYNYRVLLKRKDPELGKKFESRIHRLKLD
jgi:hypothetical protein